MPFRPQDPKLKPLLVYIDADLKQRLKIKAAALELTLTDLVRGTLAREVKDTKMPTYTRE